MPKPLLAMLGTLVLAACATAGSGVSVATNPKIYLADYELDKPQSEVLKDMGAPDNEITMDGRKAWVYRLGEGYGKRRYTFVFEDSKVHNVLYNDQGPYNGLTARELQNKGS